MTKDDAESIYSETAKRSPRRENREAAVQFLYQWSINVSDDLDGDLRLFFAPRNKPRGWYAFAGELIKGTIDNLEAIDKVITENAQNWAFNRIAKMDLAILRLAIYELLFCVSIPPIVSINEAIDISKAYSSADSRRFVNGLLDKVKSALNRPLREGTEKG